MAIDRAFVDGAWDDRIVPALRDYIRIPNKSPHFDADWSRHGYMRDAVRLLDRWCAASSVAGLAHEIVEIDGRTPVLFCEVAGSAPGAPTVLLYGHYDKQPEFTGWLPGLGPWEPVERDGRLYGRGGADDGYAVFASLTAIAALQRAQLPHARCVVLIEGCEESGSFDLPAYLDRLAPRIGLLEVSEIGQRADERKAVQVNGEAILVGGGEVPRHRFPVELEVAREGVAAAQTQHVDAEVARLPRQLQPLLGVRVDRWIVEHVLDAAPLVEQAQLSHALLSQIISGPAAGHHRRDHEEAEHGTSLIRSVANFERCFARKETNRAA